MTALTKTEIEDGIKRLGITEGSDVKDRAEEYKEFVATTEQAQEDQVSEQKII